jgi:hypothetical protein
LLPIFSGLNFQLRKYLAYFKVRKTGSCSQAFLT